MRVARHVSGAVGSVKLVLGLLFLLLAQRTWRHRPRAIASERSADIERRAQSTDAIRRTASSSTAGEVAKLSRAKPRPASRP